MNSLHSTKNLNEDFLYSLEKGKTLIIKNGKLKTPSCGELFVRWIKRQAFQQDQELVNWLIDQLNTAVGTSDYSKTFDAISKFAKTVHRTDSAFKNLDNAIFAHKCHEKLSIKIERLITKDGKAFDELLPFLKNNFLHNVIYKANKEHRTTALLLNEDQIFIRAKNGKSFVDKEHIAMILQQLPSNHSDRPALLKLKELLNETSKDCSNEIKEIQDQLELSHYKYLPLSQIRTDKKGVLISQAYMADGIEDFDHRNWTELKPNFREITLERGYKLRIVTRLPNYALQKTWPGTIKTFLHDMFDFRAHGHSWIELVEPVKNNNLNFHQNIYNVGYLIGFFLNPLNHYQRLESADPMSFIPLPPSHIITEEIKINKEQFDKAKLYIGELQKLIRSPDRHLNDISKNPNLTPEQIKEIQYLYKGTIKSTCLGFASILKEVITGIQSDYRGPCRRFLYPKKSFKKLDNIDGSLDRTFILKWLFSIPRFLLRMELPFWIKKQAQPIPSKN